MSGDIERIARAISRPGIDPRYWVVDGRILDSADAVTVGGDGVFCDVEVAGVDADPDPSTPLLGKDAGTIVTAQWLYPGDGKGGIVYTGPPQPGAPCVVIVVRGSADAGCYAIAPFQSPDFKLPAQILARPNDMHIIAPSGQQVVLGGRGAVDTSTKKAARIGDEVKTSSAEDAAFWAQWNALIVWANAQGAGVGAATTSITGKITKGSSRVLIGGASGT